LGALLRLWGLARQSPQRRVKSYLQLATHPNTKVTTSSEFVT
jgi:hypothetical protein